MARRSLSRGHAQGFGFGDRRRLRLALGWRIRLGLGWRLRLGVGLGWSLRRVLGFGFGCFGFGVVALLFLWCPTFGKESRVAFLVHLCTRLTHVTY